MMDQYQWGKCCNTFGCVTSYTKTYICCSLKINLKQTENTFRMFFNLCETSEPRWATYKTSKLQQAAVLYSRIRCISSGDCTVLQSSCKTSWLPLSNPAERVKLICGDAWWVIALSTRPLVLLTGLVWSFIYTPFCSGFQDNFPSSLQSTNYKARPPSLEGMLNREKDCWFGCLL